MSYTLLEQGTPAITWKPVSRPSPGKRRPSKRQSKPKTGKVGQTRRTAARLGLLKSQLESLIEIVLITAFCFSVFQGYLFLTQSPHLQVANVTISGNRLLSRETLLGLTDPIKGKNIFTLDLAAIGDQLNRHPWIRSVSVERRLPDNIHISVEERTPYARIQFDDIYLMDHFAVLMGPDSPEFRHLPLIAGMKGKTVKPGQSVATEDLLAGLKLMHYLNRLPFFLNNPINTLQLKKSSPAILTTRNGATRLLVDLDNLDEGFENFKIILDLIDPEKEPFEYINLSFKDQVVVKPGKRRNSSPGTTKAFNKGGRDKHVQKR
ncbi:MAG: cell division protein FtsQ/DivIB [Nitrospinales bacterium]